MDCDLDFCHEKERLFQRYSEALQSLAMAIGHLSKEIDHPAQHNVMAEAREARQTTDAAKTAYSRHVAEHGC